MHAFFYPTTVNPSDFLYLSCSFFYETSYTWSFYLKTQPGHLGVRSEIKIEYLSDVLTSGNIGKVSDSLPTSFPPTMAAEDKVPLPTKTLYHRDQA